MSGATCRLSGQLLTTPLFRSLACAHCLFYIYFINPPYSGRYVTQFCDQGLLICEGGKACSCFEDPDKIFNIPSFSLNTSLSQPLSSLHLNPPLPPDFAIVTQHCCEAAVKCCQNVLLGDSGYSSNSRKTSYTVSREVSKREPKSLTVNLDAHASCPATWDGWSCYERSSPGTVESRCPNYIFGEIHRLKNNEMDNGNRVKKECLVTGEWAKNPYKLSDDEWTDYSECSLVHTLNLIFVAGIVAFSITVISIIPAIVIISSHSALKKQVVFRIHKNLLYSFLFAALFYLFNCFFFVGNFSLGVDLYVDNHFSCKMLFTLQLRYFRLSTFTWMLGEGVYLYRLLMCTFSSEAENLKPYYILCWGFPLVITVIYSFLRHLFDNDDCWMRPSEIPWIEWIIMGPCLIALCVNLLLVLVVIYVLIKKLRYNPHLEPIQYTVIKGSSASTFRKAVRAVFMLVPVFGLHFLITIYRIQESYFQQILNLVLDGMQGFLVALIVCYTNKTVIECLRKLVGNHIEERKLRRQSEDKRIHFKRSIENSYATEKLFLGNNNTFNSTNGNLSHLRAHLSRDSDEIEDSVNISGHDEEAHVVITNLNGETMLSVPNSRRENFV